MSIISKNSDAWVLSPYCFCADRPWLSVNDVWEKDTGAGGGIPPIPGLSEEDSALLAALLTALAAFLLLLLLLLCLFCPCCLCCRKLCPCCFKGKRREKTALHGASTVGGNTVHLTAVDMRIPRAWTDGDTRFSDSEFDKRKIWDETKGRRWMEYDGLGNGTARTGNAHLSGWISGHDLGGEKDEGYKRWTGTGKLNKINKAGNSEMVALNDFYHNPPKMVSSTLRNRSNSYGSILEKLMTPRTTGRPHTDYNNDLLRSQEIAGKNTSHTSYDYFNTDSQFADQAVVTKGAEDGRKMNDVWHNTDKKDLTSSAVNSKTEDSVQNSIRQTESSGTSGYYSAVDTSRVEPPVVNSVAIASSDAVDDTSDFFRETGLTRETYNPSYNVITETSSYMKRVVEETETVTTG